MLRSHLCIAALVAALGGSRPADACKTPSPCAALVAFANDAEATTALTSKDPAIAANAVFTLASSKHAPSVQGAERALLDGKLVTSILKAQHGVRCLMPAVLRALAANPLGRAPFVALIKSKTWVEAPDRHDGSEPPTQLLRASGAIRPPPAEVIAFWKRHVGPDDGWVNVTVMALAENGSSEAIKLFDSLLRDPKHDVETRAAWLHSSFIAHRHEVLMLEMAASLLRAKLPAPLATAIGEVVFDYRQDWYGTCPGPRAPAIASYTPAARKLVRAIAPLVRAGKPDAELATAITTMISALDKP